MSWGLALGSGSFRSISYIGFLKVLEQNKLKPDFIAGTSGGAVVAAYYGAGFSPSKMESLVMLASKGLSLKKENQWRAFDKTRKGGHHPLGLYDGDAAEKILKTSLSNRDFSRMTIPTAIVATDIGSGQTIALSVKKYHNSFSKAVFVEGVKLHEAVRATISIPGLLPPKKILNYDLVDASMTNSLPADILMDMGASRVIAVDLGFSTRNSADSITQILLQTAEIAGAKLAENQSVKATLVIKPDTSQIGVYDFNKIPDLIKAGEQAAIANLNLIRQIITD